MSDREHPSTPDRLRLSQRQHLKRNDRLSPAELEALRKLSLARGLELMRRLGLKGLA